MCTGQYFSNRVLYTRSGFGTNCTSKHEGLGRREGQTGSRHDSFKEFHIAKRQREKWRCGWEGTVLVEGGRPPTPSTSTGGWEEPRREGRVRILRRGTHVQQRHPWGGRRAAQLTRGWPRRSAGSPSPAAGGRHGAARRVGGDGLGTVSTFSVKSK